MQDHVPGVVVEGEVMLGDGRLATIEGGLIAESVGAVTNGGRQVDDWTREEILVRGQDY